MTPVMRRVLPVVLLVLLLSSSVAAKDWRGILPMHSTREDVIALLGPPPQPPAGRAYMLHPGRSIYFFDEGEVYIVFADEKFLQENNCQAVPSGTVLMIRVTPKDELLVSSLNLDEKKFRKFDPSTPPDRGFEGFIDNDEGLVIRAYKGKVDQMIYLASSADRARCPEYLENPEAAVQIMLCGLIPKFDEYGDINFSDEKARLDNFAIQLKNSEKAQGVIVVYAGRKATVAEAHIRANRARDYLINVRKIDPAWVKAIDAGYQEELTVSLYLFPAGSELPPFASGLDPSEVEIIYEKKKRPQRKHP
jgi:hypothetical protein